MNGGRNYDQTVVVPRTKSGYLLEHPWILRYRFRGDKATGADNQQERLRAIEESSETVRRTSDRTDDETVRTAWRHAEWVFNPAPHPLDEAQQMNGPKVAKFLVG